MPGVVESSGEAKGVIDVVIKALNEEAHIAASIESAIAAVRPYGGKVILADSGSNDSTLPIAKEYPIVIVQLEKFDERCCGIGAQLGFQYVTGDFVYVLDGDMELVPGFVDAALSRLKTDDRLAGVAGVVQELGGGNYEFEGRKALRDGQEPGSTDYLDMGGLYRVSAIQDVGYLTNRNLHSYEEKELGARLVTAGYRLVRIDVPSVIHHGETASSSVLAIRRWRNRYLDGPGEWVRASIGSRTFFLAAKNFVAQYVIVFSWVFMLLSAALALRGHWTMFLLAIALQVSFWCTLLFKRRSIKAASFGYANLQLLGAAFLRGILRSQVDPRRVVAARVLRTDSSVDSR